MLIGLKLNPVHLSLSTSASSDHPARLLPSGILLRFGTTNKNRWSTIDLLTAKRLPSAFFSSRLHFRHHLCIRESNSRNR